MPVERWRLPVATAVLDRPISPPVEPTGFQHHGRHTTSPWSLQPARRRVAAGLEADCPSRQPAGAGPPAMGRVAGGEIALLARRGGSRVKCSRGVHGVECRIRPGQPRPPNEKENVNHSPNRQGNQNRLHRYIFRQQRRVCQSNGGRYIGKRGPSTPGSLTGPGPAASTCIVRPPDGGMRYPVSHPDAEGGPRLQRPRSGPGAAPGGGCRIPIGRIILRPDRDADAATVWRGGRVAEGAGLLNRYRVKRPIEGSNPSLSVLHTRMRT